MLFMQLEKDEYEAVKMFADDVCSLIPAKIMCRDGPLRDIFLKAAHNLRLKINSCR